MARHTSHRFVVATVIAGLALFGLTWMGGITGCTVKHEVDVTHVAPIEMTLNVNLRVDRELDNFFSYQKPATTQPSSGQPQ